MDMEWHAQSSLESLRNLHEEAMETTYNEDTVLLTHHTAVGKAQPCFSGDELFVSYLLSSSKCLCCTNCTSCGVKVKIKNASSDMCEYCSQNVKLFTSNNNNDNINNDKINSDKNNCNIKDDSGDNKNVHNGTKKRIPKKNNTNNSNESASSSLCSCGNAISVRCTQKSCVKCCTDVSCTKHGDSKTLNFIMMCSQAGCNQVSLKRCIGRLCFKCCTDVKCTQHQMMRCANKGCSNGLTRGCIQLSCKTCCTDKSCSKHIKLRCIHDGCQSKPAAGCLGLYCKLHCGEVCSEEHCPQRGGPLKCSKTDCDNEAGYVCGEKSCADCCTAENCAEPSHRVKQNKRQRRMVVKQKASEARAQISIVGTEISLETSSASDLGTIECESTTRCELVNKSQTSTTGNGNSGETSPVVIAATVDCENTAVSKISENPDLPAVPVIMNPDCPATALNTTCLCGNIFAQSCVQKSCSKCCTNSSCPRHKTPEGRGGPSKKRKQQEPVVAPPDIPSKKGKFQGAMEEGPVTQVSQETQSEITSSSCGGASRSSEIDFLQLHKENLDTVSKGVVENQETAPSNSPSQCSCGKSSSVQCEQQSCARCCLDLWCTYHTGGIPHCGHENATAACTLKSCEKCCRTPLCPQHKKDKKERKREKKRERKREKKKKKVKLSTNNAGTTQMMIEHSITHKNSDELSQNDGDSSKNKNDSSLVSQSSSATSGDVVIQTKSEQNIESIGNGGTSAESKPSFVNVDQWNDESAKLNIEPLGSLILPTHSGQQMQETVEPKIESQTNDHSAHTPELSSMSTDGHIEETLQLESETQYKDDLLLTVDEWSIHEAKVKTEPCDTGDVPREAEPRADAEDHLSQEPLDLKTEPLSNKKQSTANIITDNGESSTEPKTCLMNGHASIAPSLDEHCQDTSSSSTLEEPEPELSADTVSRSSNQYECNEMTRQTTSSGADTSAFSSLREKLDQYRAAIQQLSQVARAVISEPSSGNDANDNLSSHPPSSSLGTAHSNETLGEGSDRKLFVRYSKPGTFNEKALRESIRKICPMEKVVKIDDQSACVVLDEDVTFGIYDSICRELKEQGRYLCSALCPVPIRRGKMTLL